MIKNPADLEVRYFGLNHFGWWTSIKDKEGNEYIQQIREYVAQNGYLTQVEVDTQHTDPSWQETHKKPKDLLALTPEYLPNTYLKYYLYPDYVYDHMKEHPEYTRSNEVMEGREKRVFDHAKKSSNKDRQRVSHLKSMLMQPLLWIWHEQLRSIRMNEWS